MYKQLPVLITHIRPSTIFKIYVWRGVECIRGKINDFFAISNKLINLKKMSMISTCLASSVTSKFPKTAEEVAANAAYLAANLAPWKLRVSSTQRSGEICLLLEERFRGKITYIRVRTILCCMPRITKIATFITN